MQVNVPYLKKSSNHFTVTLRMSIRKVIPLLARFCAILRLTRDSDRPWSGSVPSTCDLDASKLRLRGGRRTQGMDMERAVRLHSSAYDVWGL